MSATEMNERIAEASPRFKARIAAVYFGTIIQGEGVTQFPPPLPVN